MAGPIVIVVLLVVFIPVMVIMSGAIVAAILGWGVKDDVDGVYEGSELVDLNR